jgi:hypothetical protein
VSELATQLIQAAHDEHAAALAAIEAGIGQIEEAEALAATLRSFGVTTVRAVGFVGSGKYLATDANVKTWAQALNTSGDALIQALRDADLQVSHINLKDGDSHGYIHLEGLECRLCADAAACIAVVMYRPTVATHG